LQKKKKKKKKRERKKERRRRRRRSKSKILKPEKEQIPTPPFHLHSRQNKQNTTIQQILKSQAASNNSKRFHNQSAQF
jgi:hypothetical protein